MGGRGIALFDEPIRVSIDADMGIGRNGLLAGMAMLGDISDLVGIVVRENGDISYLPITKFTLDWRYDVASDRWTDSNTDQ